MKAKHLLQGLAALTLFLPLAAQAQQQPATQQAAAPAAPPIIDQVPPSNVRVKDVVTFRGARFNQLQGLGLISGLQGTGDSANSIPYARRALKNMLERFGIPQINETQMRPKNIAVAMVTCNIPPFFKPGSQIDVTVSSLGDSTSLQNGFLIQTPLRGADGRIYAVAQGPISLGGFGVTTAQGASTQKNALTIGRIPNGALVEKEIPVTLMDENGYIEAYLLNPDFTTATELADKINKNLLGNAKAVDASTVRVFVTSSYRNNLAELIARIENLSLSPKNNAAKVVMDERTGTIIIGQNVSIGPVSVAHGGLRVEIATQNTVSQPNPFAPNGVTTSVSNATVVVEEHKGDTLMFVKGSTVGQLIKSLNGLGVPPRDLITILQMIKAAGALNAHLEIQ